MRTVIQHLMFTVIVTALVGCTPATRSTVPADTVTDRVAGPVVDAERFIVDAAASDIELRVFRGGRLARLGHNHVITVPDLAGDIFIAPVITASSANLTFAVAAMEIDAPERRAAAGDGFESTPSDKDIAGTRRNMLSPKLLDGDNHPKIALAVASIRDNAAGSGHIVTVEASVKEAAYRFDVPATLTQDADRLTITGEFRLLQTTLGLTPFSVALGALQVEDEMTIRYRIEARRAGPDES